MKPERWVFGGLGLFYVVVTPVYWLTAHEVAGTWVLGLSAAPRVGWPRQRARCCRRPSSRRLSARSSRQARVSK